MWQEHFRNIPSAPPMQVQGRPAMRRLSVTIEDQEANHLSLGSFVEVLLRPNLVWSCGGTSTTRYALVSVLPPNDSTLSILRRAIEPIKAPRLAALRCCSSTRTYLGFASPPTGTLLPWLQFIGSIFTLAYVTVKSVLLGTAIGSSCRRKHRRHTGTGGPAIHCTKSSTQPMGQITLCTNNKNSLGMK
ncbi:hypothetical protein JAAARDRAFT_609426 [Jaapia argillacea MUCL 33604]|uniref:Uncharacterized protein n=1 Tax=Jaapia argillacea MUCL 33604 TaxID=933084 RepID=A0A067PG76_9AGAM|nr:hypothetical protein JAAARDRAFT_609426 [Jaapia argillacea MUCL 33604]